MKALLKYLCFGYTLAYALLAQAAATEEKLSAQSLDKAFHVSIFPKEGRAVIGQYHQWVIHVVDADGKVVENARLRIGGGMEDHGHGLPSKPQITTYLGEGNYLIEGVLFNMSGRWTLLFVIQTPQVVDRVRFDFDVAF